MFSVDLLAGPLGGSIGHHSFVEPHQEVQTAPPLEHHTQRDADFWYRSGGQRDLDQLLGDVEQTLNSAHDLTGWDQVRQSYGLTGVGQTVAIIDSGIAYSHAALGGGFGANYRVVGGWDFAENDSNPFDDPTEGGHGTHVAGIVGADRTGTNDDGVAPGVDLVGLRVFNDAGDGYFSWVESALSWVHTNRNAFENPITAVNLSLGTDWNSASIPSWAMLENEFAQLEADGIFISVSAGNSFGTYNAPGLSYPAASPYVVPVMSLDDNGSLSYYSQRYSTAIGAPGRTITSTVPDYAGNNNGVTDDYASWSGTSMAAPYLAGASAIIRQAMEFVGQTNIDEWDIYDHIVDTADSFYDSATSQWYNRLNLEAAIDALMPADDYGSTSATAYNLGTLSGSSQVSGVIGQLSDVDYFRFTASSTGTVTFTADPSHELVVSWSGSGSANGNVYTLQVQAGQQYTVGLSTSSGLGYYDLAIDAASTFTYTDWGTVTQSQTNNLANSGTQWYRVTASQAGYMTAEAFFTGASGNIDLAWFNTNLQQVASGVSSTNSERVERTVSQGEQLYLRVTGTNADVDFRLTNLVLFSGTTVNVTGTGQADTFAYTGGSSHSVTVNGAAYSFSSGAVSMVVVNGGAGSDSLTVKSGSVANMRTDSVETVNDLDARAYVANQDFGLRLSGGYYLNYSGFNEKWMLGNNSWYFVTPDGTLYRSTGSANLASNVEITELDATFYANPALIHEAVASNVMQAQQTLTQVAYLGLHFHISYFQNWGGWNEKWVYSSTNQPYFITPNGNLYQWAGGSDLSLSPLVANLDTKFYTDPTLLENVDEFGSWAAGSAAQLNQNLGLFYQGSYSVNWGGWGEKWMRGAGNNWYFITPNGGLYHYQGGGPGNLRSSPLVGVLDASFHAFPSRLHEAPAPQSTSIGPEPESLSQLAAGTDGGMVAGAFNSQLAAASRETWVPSGRTGRSHVATGKSLLAAASESIFASSAQRSSSASTTGSVTESARATAFDELSSSAINEIDSLVESLQALDATPLQTAFSQLGAHGE